MVGRSERLIGMLADGFTRSGCQATVLTAQWDQHWPTAANHGGVVVRRFPHPGVPGWGTARYLWSLTRWLDAHRREFDAVIVSELKYDAYAVLTALAHRELPIIVRAEHGGPHGDCNWQTEARFGQRVRRRSMLADGIVAPTQQIAEELSSAHYPSQRIAVIANGVETEPRTPQSCAEARAILAESNPDLRVTDETFVGLYVGTLHADRGLHDLIRAWRKIVDLWPDARLWLVGEGPARSDLYDRLRDSELKYHVSMPGAFDDTTELLQAADVFVMPCHEAGGQLAVLEAMSVGLPVVTTRHPDRADAIAGETALIVAPRSPVALAEAIVEAGILKEAAARRVHAAQRLVQEQHSLSAMVAGHLDLIERLRRR